MSLRFNKKLVKIAKSNPSDWKIRMTELSDLGAVADTRFSKGLYYACKNNNADMAEFLIKRGARPCERDCLKYAVYHQNVRLIRLLIANRAKIKKVRFEGLLFYLISKELNKLIYSCQKNKFYKASRILRYGCIPKELFPKISHIIWETKNDYLRSVFLSEISNEKRKNLILGDSKLSDDCPICLQPFMNSVVSHCGHLFHKKCIYKWLSFNRNCPMCKNHIQKIEPTTEFYFKKCKIQNVH